MKLYLGIKHPTLGSLAITGSHSLTLNLHSLSLSLWRNWKISVWSLSRLNIIINKPLDNGQTKSVFINDLLFTAGFISVARIVLSYKSSFSQSENSSKLNNESSEKKKSHFARKRIRGPRVYQEPREQQEERDWTFPSEQILEPISVMTRIIRDPATLNTRSSGKLVEPHHEQEYKTQGISAKAGISLRK